MARRNGRGASALPCRAPVCVPVGFVRVGCNAASTTCVENRKRRCWNHGAIPPIVVSFLLFLLCSLCNLRHNNCAHDKPATESQLTCPAQFGQAEPVGEHYSRQEWMEELV